jgi:RNA polymerase sigma factor for flagellar operon FliA
MAAEWSEYVANHDPSTRDRLIVSYLFLVEETARRAHVRLAGRVPLDDLASAGTLGLMDAVDAYDPRRGISFESFATFRIRGAMLDEVRAMDWAPRSVRVAERRLLAGRAAVSHALGRAATVAEVAEHLGLPPEAVLRTDCETRATHVVPLSALASASHAGDDADRDADLPCAAAPPDPADCPSLDDVGPTFLRRLGQTERLVVRLYYGEGLTLREVGGALGLSEGRVSQLHARALTRLRELAGVVPTPHARPRRGRRPATAPRANGIIPSLPVLAA